jgi:hypothetical protein
MKTIRFIVYNDYGVEWDFFIESCVKYYSTKKKDNLGQSIIY